MAEEQTIPEIHVETPRDTTPRDNDSRQSSRPKSTTSDKPEIQTSVGPDEKTEIDEDNVKKMMEWVKEEDQERDSLDSVDEIEKDDAKDAPVHTAALDSPVDDIPPRTESHGMAVDLDIKTMTPIRDHSPRVISTTPGTLPAKSDVAAAVIPKLPSIKPANASIARIPSPPLEQKEEVARMMVQRQTTMMKYPPQMMRLSKVSVSARVRGSSKQVPYFPTSRSAQHSPTEPPQHPKPEKVIRWDEATNSRPPLRIDMDGPTPTSYSPHLYRPLNENISPSFSFGRRCFIEKDHCSRTSWQKSWHHSPDVWKNKADFHSDKSWPSPVHYTCKPQMGTKQVVNPDFPVFSFGYKREKPTEELPSPNHYDPDKADNVTKRKAPAYTHSSRRYTVPWPTSTMKTPGPGAYSPKVDLLHVHRPAFTIRGIRRKKDITYGPFATL